MLPTIQERLLDCISMALSKSSYPSKLGAIGSRGNMIIAPQQISDISGSALVQLALRTLARFNFKVILLDFHSICMLNSCVSHANLKVTL